MTGIGESTRSKGAAALVGRGGTLLEAIEAFCWELKCKEVEDEMGE